MNFGPEPRNAEPKSIGLASWTSSGSLNGRSSCRAPKRRHVSRRAPMVLMDESAQDIAASDLRAGPRFRVKSRIGRLKLEAPMRPGQVVVLGVRPEDAAQVTPAEDQDVVEALPSN